MSRERIVRLGIVFVAAAALLILALLQLAVVEHDIWLERSYRNRWAFKDVPTRRGAIFDRNGVALAWDAPGFDLELTYALFRREHPVGAVRHGADLVHQGHTGEAPYTFEQPQHLAAALDDLLTVPAPWLWDGAAWPRAAEVLGYADSPEGVATDVRFYTLSAIAELAGVPRHSLAVALRRAVLDAGDTRSVAEVVAGAAESDRALAPLRGGAAELRQKLRTALGERIDELARLDARLLMRSGSGAGDDWSLWARLERAHADWIEYDRLLALAADDAEEAALRDHEFWQYLSELGWSWSRWDDWLLQDRDERERIVAAFEEERERRRAERAREVVGLDRFVAAESERPRSLFAALPVEPEELVAPLFRDQFRPVRVRSRLEHEAAVWLALLSERHPGFALRASVRREHGRLPGRDELSSLAALVGAIGTYDTDGRSPEYDAVRRIGEADEFARIEEGLPDDLEESLRRTAARTLRAHYAIFGRIGRGGVESVRDDVLSGRPGIRFVERDKRARETRMFERLDVSPGNPVTMTIDVRLQALAERAVGVPARDSEVALAVVDPWTGDVLALVGLRNRANPPEDEDPQIWTRGATPPERHPYVGSVAKPLVALEYLRALRVGSADAAAELVDPTRFPSCDGRWKPDLAVIPYRGAALFCGSRRVPHTHGGLSHSTPEAIAVSCNTHFFEAASRLGPSALARAYARFGWEDLADAADVPEEAYQQRVEGMSFNYGGGPSLEGGKSVPLTGIGYGVNVWPTFVARAYAGIATGLLPRLRIVRDAAPASVPLPYTEREFAEVREGLELCIRHHKGTARGLADLAQRLETERGAVLAGKTGTAVVQERSEDDELPELNNAWFAGYVADASGAQLAFAAVVYRTADSGGTAAAPVVQSFFEALLADDELAAAYLHGEAR